MDMGMGMGNYSIAQYIHAMRKTKQLNAWLAPRSRQSEEVIDRWRKFEMKNIW